MKNSHIQFALDHSLTIAELWYPKKDDERAVLLRRAVLTAIAERDLEKVAAGFESAVAARVGTDNWRDWARDAARFCRAALTLEDRYQDAMAEVA